MANRKKNKLQKEQKEKHVKADKVKPGMQFVSEKGRHHEVKEVTIKGDKHKSVDIRVEGFSNALHFRASGKVKVFA